MLTPRRLAILVIAALAPFAWHIRAANACSCAKMDARTYYKNAARVFVARALPVKKVGKTSTQTLQILHTFKGPSTKTYVIRRSRLTAGLCEAEFVPGSTRLVFAKGGRLGLCSGNLGFPSQLEMFPVIFRLDGRKPGQADARSMRAALRAALSGYTHKRRTIGVGYRPLHGKAFRLGTTSLVYRRQPKKADVRIDHALTIGDLAFVAGRYGKEGISFAVLVHRPKSRNAVVLAKYVTEG